MKTLFFNGNFITLTAHSPVTWVLVENGKILSLGKNDTPVFHTTHDLNRINLKKQYVTPGLEDSHVHFAATGSSKTIIDLRNLNSKKNFYYKIFN